MSVNIINQRFGRLTVMEFSHKITRKSKNNYYFNCKCDCGKFKIVNRNSLIGGNTRSCGCLFMESRIENARKRKEKFDKDFPGGRPLKTIRIDMIRRCHDPRREAYKNYGGRGIHVCKQWRDSFESFYSWCINNGYKDGLCIDRINNDGDYCPSNCKFSTYIEQSNNRRSSCPISFNGETHSRRNWERKLGFKTGVILGRLQRGWDIEKILTTPVIKRKLKQKYEQKLHYRSPIK